MSDYSNRPIRLHVEVGVADQIDLVPHWEGRTFGSVESAISFAQHLVAEHGVLSWRVVDESQNVYERWESPEARASLDRLRRVAGGSGRESVHVPKSERQHRLEASMRWD